MSREEALFSTGVFGAIPMFFISGSSLLPDAPLIFFWVLSLYLFKKNLYNPSSKGWVLFGLSAGAAMLSKYTGVFLFCAAYLCILLSKEKRKELGKPGPYLAAFAGLIVFSPVIIWNLQTDFASFAFQSGRVGISGIRIRYFFQSIGGQIGYLLPFYFFPTVYIGYKSLKKFRENEIYLFSALFGALPVLFFWIASLFRRGLPHWPVIGYISLAPLTGIYLYSLNRRRRRLFTGLAAIHLLLTAAAGGTAILQTKTGFLMNRPLPESDIPERARIRDLTVEISGWDLLGDYLKSIDMEDTFLFTYRWELGGYISFGVKGEYPVLCLEEVNRARGFSFWQNQDDHIGEDGIFIVSSRYFRDPLETYLPYFDRIELIKEIPLIRRGATVKKIFLYRCENFAGGFEVF